MTKPRSLLIALLAAAALLPVSAQDKGREGKQNGPDVFTGVRRVVAFGDIHADRPVLEALLRRARLIGPNGTNWTGGDTHLVLTSDFVDRGPSSCAVLAC